MSDSNDTRAIAMPERNVEGYIWRDPVPPNIEGGNMVGRLRSCGYCGSMHPADVAAAIRAGAHGHWADAKYGWPHKAYFDGIPNPHTGMLESRAGHSNPPLHEIEQGKWISVPTGRFDESTGKPTSKLVEPGTPAPATTHGKFYTIHLQDATPEDRDVIERHLGLRIEFHGERVTWRRVKGADHA